MERDLDAWGGSLGNEDFALTMYGSVVPIESESIDRRCFLSIR